MALTEVLGGREDRREGWEGAEGDPRLLVTVALLREEGTQQHRWGRSGVQV